MSTNALAKKQPLDKPTALAKKLEESYAMALPRHVTKEQFARALLTSFRRTPALVNCEAQTVANAVVTAAQLGLMIGVNGSCWLIPYGKECNLIIGYQGLVDLCYRSSRVDSIFADVVCRNDLFDFEQGLNQRLNHTPCMDGERGEPYAVYAMASIKESDRPVFVVLTRSEVMKIRNSSPAAKTKQSPWNGPFETEMWKKTAIRRLSKLLPKSVDLMEALEFENRQEARWTEASVEDDPFTQGRNSLPSRSAANADSGPATQSGGPENASAADVAYLDAYKAIAKAYSDPHNCERIDQLIYDHKLPGGCFTDIDIENLPDQHKPAIIAIAKEMKE